MTCLLDQERKQSVVIVIKFVTKTARMTTVYTDVIDLVLFLSKCHFVTNNEVSVTKTLKISPALLFIMHHFESIKCQKN